MSPCIRLITEELNTKLENTVKRPAIPETQKRKLVKVKTTKTKNRKEKRFIASNDGLHNGISARCSNELEEVRSDSRPPADGLSAH